MASKILLTIVDKENIGILDQLKWSISKLIFHSHNTCLLDLFYLAIQKYLMFKVFTSNAITVIQENKTRNFCDLYMYIYILYIPLKLQNEHIGHVSISYYFLLLSSKNSPNCFTTFGSSVCQGSISCVLLGTAI